MDQLAKLNVTEDNHTVWIKTQLPYSEMLAKIREKFPLALDCSSPNVFTAIGKFYENYSQANNYPRVWVFKADTKIPDLAWGIIGEEMHCMELCVKIPGPNTVIVVSPHDAPTAEAGRPEDMICGEFVPL